MASLPTNNRWKRDPPTPEKSHYPKNNSFSRGRSRPGRGRHPRNNRLFRRPEKPPPPKAPDISSMETFPSLGGNMPRRKKETLDYKTKAQGVFNLPKHTSIPPKRNERQPKKEDDAEIDYNHVAAHEDKCVLTHQDEYDSSDDVESEPNMMSLKLKKKLVVKAPPLS